MRRSKLAAGLLSACLALALASGCAGKPEPAAAPAVELNVSAAMGLKDALLDIQKEYQAKNPNVKLVYNLAASGALQTQIEQGAPADIFISAANKQLDDLQKKNLVNTATRRPLVGNQLVLVVPKDSKLALTGFKDLARDEVKKFGMGAPETVPAGQYGMEVLQSLGVWDGIRDKAVLAKDVHTVLTYAETGNIEAGIVFATVAATSDKIKVVAAAPAGSHEPIIFPGAVLTNAKQPKAAEQFLAYLSTPEAGKIFQKYGFNVITSKE